ncbi:MAG TPA: phytanoyl-CoA dioxygenase family protein [Pyrinomonadaceae bacterium]|nr:phytanoyl-CoA dioxygenase family protein [Pyrinomonadaceae bacterium]
MDWHTHLRTRGYAHFPRLVPQRLVGDALDAIARDLRENYDPARQLEYDNRSSCPDLRGTPPVMNLLEASPARDVLDEALGVSNVEWDKGQIALRRAHNWHEPAPPVAHLDGFASDYNGVEEGAISSLTALVGVFLTPVRREFAGNYTVWPGSHEIYERYFRGRGERAMREPMPVLEIGEPTQLLCEPGDAVLVHYQLAHTAAVNTSDDDRVAVYFRIWLRGLEERRWHHLTNIWDGWRI